MASTKIAVIYYSLYGHIRQMAEAAAKGIAAADPSIKVDLLQIHETLPDEVIAKMHGAPKSTDHPVLDPQKLVDYDGFLFGIPTRYGRAVGQWSAVFDQTGGLWAKGALYGKFAGIFSSTATQHGGLETTALTTIPYLTHQGIIFVPLGYGDPSIMGMGELVGGSPWGAGTMAAGDGSRQPTAGELATAEFQGKAFANVVHTYNKGKSASSDSAPVAARAVPTTTTTTDAAPAPALTTEGYKVAEGTTKPAEVQAAPVDKSSPSIWARCCGQADKNFTS